MSESNTTVFVFAAQKGGPGKSTAAYELARYLTANGKRVLLVDGDPQADVTLLCRLDKMEPDKEKRARLIADHDLSFVLGGLARPTLTLAQAALKVEHEGFWLVPTQADLENVQAGLAQRQTGALTAMRKAIKELRATGAFDAVVLDCATGFGHLTMNMIVAADWLVIPAKPEPTSLRGIKGVQYLLAELGDAEPVAYPVPKIAGTIASMVESNIRHRAGLALLKGDKEAFASVADRVNGEFAIFATEEYPRCLGVIPKINSLKASQVMRQAYGAVYDEMFKVIG